MSTYTDLRTRLVPAVVSRLVTGRLPSGAIAADDRVVAMMLVSGPPTNKGFGGSGGWATSQVMFQARAARYDDEAAVSDLDAIVRNLDGISGPVTIDGTVYRFGRVLNEPYFHRQDEQERPVYQALVELEREL